MKPKSIISNLPRQFAKRCSAGARTSGRFTVTNSSRSADFRPLQRPEVKGLPTNGGIRQSSSVAVATSLRVGSQICLGLRLRDSQQSRFPEQPKKILRMPDRLTDGKKK
jgi:hypothetical protein